MRALRKFLTLARGDRRLIMVSAAALAGIGIGLKLLAFTKVLKIVNRFSDRNSCRERGSRHRPDTLVWAVLAVSRYSPVHFGCLVQALAAKIVLGREGYPAVVRIGVAPTGGGGLRAHAWLECCGETLIGGKDREDFRALPCFDRGEN